MTESDKRKAFFTEPLPPGTSLREGSITHRIVTPCAPQPSAAPAGKKAAAKTGKISGTKPPFEVPVAVSPPLMQVAQSVGSAPPSATTLFAPALIGESTVPGQIYAGDTPAVVKPTPEYDSTPVVAVPVFEAAPSPAEAEKTAEATTQDTGKRRRRNRRQNETSETELLADSELDDE